VGDDALPLRDQLDELAVHFGQAQPQVFERHSGSPVEVRGVVPAHRGWRKINAGIKASNAFFLLQPDEEEGMSHHLELVSESRCFEGFQRTYRHQSESCRCTMQFAVYLPPAAERGPVPAVYWLSGLTCTEENFSVKSGAQRYASELGLALIIPDTSPRGVNIPGEDDRVDVGSAA